MDELKRQRLIKRLKDVQAINQGNSEIWYIKELGEIIEELIGTHIEVEEEKDGTKLLRAEDAYRNMVYGNSMKGDEQLQDIVKLINKATSSEVEYCGNISDLNIEILEYYGYHVLKSRDDIVETSATIYFGE